MQCQICGRNTEYYSMRTENKIKQLEGILIDLDDLSDQEALSFEKDKKHLIEELGKFDKKLGNFKLSLIVSDICSFSEIDPNINQLEDLILRIDKTFNKKKRNGIILHANNRTGLTIGMGGNAQKELINIYHLSILELIDKIEMISFDSTNQANQIKEKNYIRQRIESLKAYTRLYSTFEIFDLTKLDQRQFRIPKLDLTRINKGEIHFDDIYELYDMKICFVCKNILEENYRKVNKMNDDIKRLFNSC